MRRGVVILAILVGVLFVGYGTAYLASDDVRFLTRAGFEETRILKARQPITTLVADPDVDPALRASLGLVLEVRDYADSIGLRAKKTYTTYADVERDTLLLVLSASPRDCLCPYLWKYPIVGRVPYKGFFDFDMAHSAARDMEGRGYDTYLRPSAAFSTLGWFNDPLLSTAVTPDSVELAALVFHEITHNTFFAPSAVSFNEGLAQMVGYLTAAQFFEIHGDSALGRRARNRWHDEVVLSSYYANLTAQLDSLYGAEVDSLALEIGRDSVATWSAHYLATVVGPELLTFRVDTQYHPINNARIISRRIYRSRLALFDAWYRHHGEDIEASMAALATLLDGVEGDSTWTVLERAVSASGEH